MGKIQVIASNVEERPEYFEFTKKDFVEFSPTMANLDYDPFPTKKPEDVVRKEIIAWKLVLAARLAGDVSSICRGTTVPVNGRNFAITTSEIRVDPEGRDSGVHVAGEAFLTPREPLKVLARLRAALVKK